MITMHVQLNHPQPHVAQGASQQQLGVGCGHCKTEKIPRPILARRISEDKSSLLQTLAQIIGEEVIPNQLISCCSDELSEEFRNLLGEQLDIKLGNLFGEHLDTKTEEQLLSEMCRLALVAQNNL